MLKEELSKRLYELATSGEHKLPIGSLVTINGLARTALNLWKDELPANRDETQQLVEAAAKMCPCLKAHSSSGATTGGTTYEIQPAQ